MAPSPETTRQRPRPTRRRPARLARWGGLTLAILIFLADFASRPLYFFATPLSRVHLGLAKGGIRVRYDRDLRRDDWGMEFNGGDPGTWWFRIERLRFSSVDVTVPLWPFMTTAIAMSLWGFIHRKRERRAAPTCPRCGYDLTGIANTCPECGTTPRSRTPTA
jgi:hypothetical protein